MSILNLPSPANKDMVLFEVKGTEEAVITACEKLLETGFFRYNQEPVRCYQPTGIPGMQDTLTIALYVHILNRPNLFS